MRRFGYILKLAIACNVVPKRVFSRGLSKECHIISTANGLDSKRTNTAHGSLGLTVSRKQLGTLQTAVNGGEFVSYLNILNKNPGISTASLVISVVAEDIPENIILDVDLGFTPPGSGSEIKFDHSSYYITAIPSPETYITFPENSEVKYSSYWSALWCHEDGDSFSDDFTDDTEEDE